MTKNAALNQRQLALLECVVDLQDRRATTRDAAYLTREMILCTLPHRDPKGATHWKRKTGDVTLLIEPGRDEDGTLFGVPFGILPRLLLYWLISEIKRTNQRRVILAEPGLGEHGWPSFMRALGMNTQPGGVRSDSVRLKDAMQRLFHSRITYHEIRHYPGDRIRQRTMHYEMVVDSLLWWHKDFAQFQMKEPVYVKIGEEMFNAIQSSAVPADMRAIRALKSSPMELDLYAMLNYIGANSPRTVKWRELQQRLGTSYTEIRHFRKAVQEALPKVLAVHPGLIVEIPEEGGGLRISASQPAIPRLA